jgi:hypothetical protein
MYLVSVNQSTRDDIAAAAAAHRELGPDYEQGVAESLVDRIGAEVDRRVDARLAQRGQAAQAVAPARPGGSSFPAVLLGLGSMGIGIGAAGAVLSLNSGATLLVALIWIIIGVVNVAYNRRR